LLDQRLRQLTVHAPLRHAIEIGHELVSAVGRDCHGGKERVVDLRNKAADFRRTGMDEAKPGAGIAGVAAIFGLRGLLQPRDALRPAPTRRARRLEGRAAASDDNDVALFDARHARPQAYSSALMPANAMYSLTSRSGTADSFCVIRCCSSAPLTA